MQRCLPISSLVTAATLVLILSACNDSSVDQRESGAAKETAPMITATVEQSKSNSFSVGGGNGRNPAQPETPDKVLDRSKAYLIEQVDSRLEQLAQFKSKIEKIQDLNDTARHQEVAQVAGEMEKFTAFKTEINSSTGKEELTGIVDKMKAEWIQSRLLVAQIQKRVLAIRENRLISEAETASAGLRQHIDKLRAAGKNTQADERLVTEFNAKITEAKNDLVHAQEQAKAAEEATNDEEKARRLADRAHSEQHARDTMRDAYKLVGKESRRDFSARFK